MDSEVVDIGSDRGGRVALGGSGARVAAAVGGRLVTCLTTPGDVWPPRQVLRQPVVTALSQPVFDGSAATRVEVLRYAVADGCLRDHFLRPLLWHPLSTVAQHDPRLGSPVLPQR
jgi:hypothetical protein